ncbi:MAG: hypothetical protein N3H31_05955 [Candidatus Nezhaarchaeota archaeon]|nr:hypothetical protein [Candidatus Nezhaarchaeota archaeon]
MSLTGRGLKAYEEGYVEELPLGSRQEKEEAKVNPHSERVNRALQALKENLGMV